MFKLFKGELKKIFLKPSLFVITILLAIVITFSYYFYMPSSRTNTEVEIKGGSVSEIYVKFNSGNDLYSKQYAESILNSSLSLIESYSSSTIESEDPTPKSKLLNYVSKINEYVKAWVQMRGNISSNPGAIYSYLYDPTVKLREQVTNTQSYFTSIGELSNPIILLTVNEYSYIKSELDIFIEKLNNAVDGNKKSSYDFLFEYILEINSNSKPENFVYNITDNINKINSVSVESSFLESLQIDYYNVAQARLVNIQNKIDEINSNCVTDEEQVSATNKAEINKYISFYNANCSQMYDILTTKIKLEIAKGYKETQFRKYINCSDFNRYEYSQLLTRQQFLFDNNKADYEYATPLSFGSISNFKPNAYDFTYYVLELFSFLIIVYCVILGSGMIAGEQNNGTLKLLAIRPYKRSKILFSKMLATMFFVVIFVTLSTIISMIAGSVLYGLDSMPILLIYNASTSIVTTPLLALILYLISLLIKIFVYIVLAFALSTIFRSYIVSTTVSILCLFVTSIFSIFLSGASFFKYLPLNNLDLFKFFGGGRFLTDETNALTSIFSSPILPDTTFMFSFTTICITIVILIIVTYEVFKRRDIA